MNKGLFAIHYRLKDSEQELADVVTDNNDGKEYDVSFVNTFEAKEIAGYRAITPRLEASIQHKGVNDVVFEYEKSLITLIQLRMFYLLLIQKIKKQKSEITAPSKQGST